MISQNPVAGASVRRAGTAVDLVVSLGPAQVDGAGCGGPVAGRMRNRRSLAANLSVGGVTTANRCDGAGGRCDQSEPGGGCQSADERLGGRPGGVVRPGASATVPDVVGLSQVNAETAILAANLSVGNGHHGRTDTTVPAGDVISQNPVAGASR